MVQGSNAKMNILMINIIIIISIYISIYNNDDRIFDTTGVDLFINIAIYCVTTLCEMIYVKSMLCML